MYFVDKIYGDKISRNFCNFSHLKVKFHSAKSRKFKYHFISPVEIWRWAGCDSAKFHLYSYFDMSQCVVADSPSFFTWANETYFVKYNFQMKTTYLRQLNVHILKWVKLKLNHTWYTRNLNWQ